MDEFEGPDLIVAGAGGGLVAALRAAKLGLSVLVIEANEHFARGNNTSMSTGMIPGVNTRFQREAGITDSVETFLADVRRKTGGEFQEAVARALAEVSGEMVEWLVDEQILDLSIVTDMSYPGHSVHRCHNIPLRSGRSLMQALVQAVRSESMIDIFTPAALTNAYRDDDGVLTVGVNTPGGAEEIPTRALLVSTNGFGANREMVQSFIPEMNGAVYFGSEFSTGDGIQVGTSLGGATGYMDAYQGHAGLAMPAGALATWATVMHGGYLVNQAGQRYGNEASGYSEYSAESLTHADGKAWIIIDERIHEACLVFQDYLDVVNQGGVKWADSVAELASNIGIDAEGFQETARIATASAHGAADPFGRTEWEAPLTGKLGAIHVQPALFHTQGGLLVNEHAQVLDAHDNPIEGVYASGGAAAGISGHGAAGYLAGNGLLPAFGLAYLAAGHAARSPR